MTHKSLLFNIWTDGSYRPAHHSVGAGWLIRHDDKSQEGQNNIRQLHGNDVPHGSDIAEVFAVVCALRHVPPGADALLRMSSQNVIDWLNQKQIGTPSKLQVPCLKKLFGEVMGIAESLSSLRVIKVSEGNKDLSRAHELSRAASTPGKLERK